MQETLLACILAHNMSNEFKMKYLTRDVKDKMGLDKVAAALGNRQLNELIKKRMASAFEECKQAILKDNPAAIEKMTAKFDAAAKDRETIKKGLEGAANERKKIRASAKKDRDQAREHARRMRKDFAEARAEQRASNRKARREREQASTERKQLFASVHNLENRFAKAEAQAAKAQAQATKEREANTNTNFEQDEEMRSREERLAKVEAEQKVATEEREANSNTNLEQDADILSNKKCIRNAESHVALLRGHAVLQKRRNRRAKSAKENQMKN